MTTACRLSSSIKRASTLPGPVAGLHLRHQAMRMAPSSRVPRPEPRGGKECEVLDFITRELGGRGVGALVAFLLGGLVSWALGRWKRMRQRQSILRGDARDTVVI